MIFSLNLSENYNPLKIPSLSFNSFKFSGGETHIKINSDKTIIENVSTGSGIFQTVDYDGRRTDTSLGKFDATTGSSALTITGSGQPNNIHIEGMTLRYSTSTGFSPHLSLISLDCVDGGTVRDMKLEGKKYLKMNTSLNPFTEISTDIAAIAKKLEEIKIKYPEDKTPDIAKALDDITAALSVALHHVGDITEELV